MDERGETENELLFGNSVILFSVLSGRATLFKPTYHVLRCVCLLCEGGLYYGSLLRKYQTNIDTDWTAGYLQDLPVS